MSKEEDTPARRLLLRNTPTEMCVHTGRLCSDIQNASKMPEKWQRWGFPGGPAVKNLPCSAGDTGVILVQEDAMCVGATQPLSLHVATAEARVPRARALQQEQPLQ